MRRPYVLALLAAVLATACLREVPGLGGKSCKPASSECGGGLACVDTNAAGVPLSLPATSPGGVCEVAPLDCGPGLATCPDDAGFWICAPHVDPKAGCFAHGVEELAGSVCMVDVGQCRGYGVFVWSGDDGGCQLPSDFDPQSHLTPECIDGGATGSLCLCDGLDQNCDGIADDFPPDNQLGTVHAEPRVLAGSAGCGLDAGGLVLEPGGANTLGGTAVGSCAELALVHGYSISDVVVQAAAAPQGACGRVDDGGVASALSLFVFGVDGGVVEHDSKPVGGALAQTVDFPFAALNARAVALCLGATEARPLFVAQVSVARSLQGHCDVR